MESSSSLLSRLLKRKRKRKRKGKNKKNRSMVKNPPWLEQGEDIWANILHRLGAIEILETAQKVCTTCRRVGKDPSMWRVINMSNHGDLFKIPYDLEVMCHHAIDRSQGELVHIHLEYFASDQLLQYTAERSGKLKRLRIACCYR
ncbi:F-box protein SKIP19-like [Lycium ferocissimum]|uniref:F-box protein SKIP19-like n=1 Tax=Lycium ferocissimum TaxID=112874 RepID=UPI0028162AED|nr:F-box protein SKIP19-like [Lycium ferocissimum]